MAHTPGPRVGPVGSGTAPTNNPYGNVTPIVSGLGWTNPTPALSRIGINPVDIAEVERIVAERDAAQPAPAQQTFDERAFTLNPSISRLDQTLAPVQAPTGFSGPTPQPIVNAGRMTGGGVRTQPEGQAPTGFGPSYTGAFPDVDIAGNIAEYARQYYETAYGQVDDEFNKQLGRLNEDYGETIGEMQGILDDYRQGRIDADTAYDEYQKRSAAILSAAITAPVDPVQSAVDQAVAKEYAQAGGALGELAQTLDAGGPPERFGEALSEIQLYQDVMVEAVRQELMTLDQVHHATTEVATALAKSAYADDQYRSEYAQEQLAIQINSAIDKQAAELKKAQDAWDKAKRRLEEDRADAYNNIPDYEIDEEFFYSEAFKEWAAGMGFDQAQSDALRAKGLEAWEASGGDLTAYRNEVRYMINEYNMGSMGVLEAWNAMIGQLEGIDPLLANRMLEVAQSKDFASQSSTFITLWGLAGQAVRNVSIDKNTGQFVEPFPRAEELWTSTLTSMMGVGDFEGLWTTTDPFVQGLYNYGTFRKDFETEIIAEREKQAERDRARYHTGSQAPNNLKNRNTPDYVYRRETLVPDFLKDFTAEFGSINSATGKATFGGANTKTKKGISMSPEGKANNSDHISGGAVDLYAKDEASRRQIAAWARSDPRVSMVIYEGDSRHEGHHVHVSLAVGYRI